jgi:hypothetical protein
MGRTDRCVPGSFPFLGGNQPIGELLSHDDRPAQTLVPEQVPEAAAASDSEESKFSITRLAPQEVQHRMRVATGKPLLLGHAFTPGCRIPVLQVLARRRLRSRL